MGITVRMYFGDHPPPHIHVFYSGFEALVNVETSEIIEGSLPRRVQKLVTEWIDLRKDDIMENWKRAEALEPLQRIPGLDD